MLTLKNLTVAVGDKDILHGIDFRFDKGKTYIIMGPNGSGKSTLARSVMGDKTYRVSGQIKFNGQVLTGLTADKIGRMGIFVSFQNPPAIDGVTTYQLFFTMYAGKDNFLNIKTKIDAVAQKLGIFPELLDRPMNQHFSGGEKKKLEVLQAILIDPQLFIFDEIDSGLDTDSLKTIFRRINELKAAGKTTIIISHYQKVVDYLQPDCVLVMKKGIIARTGDRKLAAIIDKEGYR